MQKWTLIGISLLNLIIVICYRFCLFFLSFLAVRASASLSGQPTFLIDSIECLTSKLVCVDAVRIAISACAASAALVFSSAKMYMRCMNPVAQTRKTYPPSLVFSPTASSTAFLHAAISRLCTLLFAFLVPVRFFFSLVLTKSCINTVVPF